MAEPKGCDCDERGYIPWPSIRPIRIHRSSRPYKLLVDEITQENFLERHLLNIIKKKINKQQLTCKRSASNDAITPLSEPIQPTLPRLPMVHTGPLYQHPIPTSYSTSTILSHFPFSSDLEQRCYSLVVFFLIIDFVAEMSCYPRLEKYKIQYKSSRLIYLQRPLTIIKSIEILYWFPHKYSRRMSDIKRMAAECVK